MNILQIHSSDHRGGGGGTVAMERLHHGLRLRGVGSRIIAGRKTIKSEHTKSVPRGRLTSKLEELFGRVTGELGLNDIHYLSSFRIPATDFYKEADLVHIHGTHGFFNYLALPKLTRDKPALFTLHDMWPLTGHCAYSLDCEKWASGCGHCPHLDTHPAVKRDNTRIEWKLKRSAYARSRIEFVTVSHWLTEIAKRSMLAQHPIHYIPNGIDTDLYAPIDPLKCREALGIADARYVIIFVALSLNDKRKGGDVVAQALRSLPESMKRETCLIVLGDGGESISESLGMRTVDLGYIRNDRLKVMAYSAADVFLLPTRADNLPLVLLESMACETPVISTSVGGVPELVRDGETGRLAAAGSAEDLSHALEDLLNDASGRAQMAQRGRELIAAEYSIASMIDSHMALYDQVLSHKPAPLKIDATNGEGIRVHKEQEG
jgi:glycosyltransferase involved in cell wall biosynthesis